MARAVGDREAQGRIEDARRDGQAHLSLAGMELSSLPASLGRLTQLQTLNVANNQLMMLPESLSGLTRLQGLDLAGNLLSALPESLGALEQLGVLTLAENQLSALPESLGRLSQLRALDLRDNELASLPESLGRLTRLQALDLGYNQLSALPESLGGLTQLEVLTLAGNGLSALPESLGRLTRLQALDLGYNQLSALPEWLGGLTRLQTLSLHGNRLSSLPEWLGRLTRLQELDLRQNQLSSLSEWLGRLTRLQSVLLHGNPELGIPPEVLGPEPQTRAPGDAVPEPRAIFDWYFRNRAATAKRPILEAKVTLLGWGAVGKTSLRRRLLGDAFDPQETQTHKITNSPWPVKVGQDQVTLNVWDFGGQEVMHATHQFFLTKRSLYVLVLAGRERAQGAQDAEYWLRLIEGFGGGSPTLVVLNKQDTCPFDLNRQALREKYPFIRGFVATDSHSGLGLPELRERILAEVDRLPDLRTEFDARWLAVKDAVAGMKRTGKRRMTVEEYFALCRAKGEPDPKWQKWLLGFLHDLGVVVCFHDDPRLANDGVLDPQWVVDGIYRVLNEPTFSSSNGRASYEQVRRLLPAAEYTDAEVRVLLDMMEKFQLAFWLDTDRTELVIPELMTEEEPNWTATFPAPEAGLQFELKYNFLPRGLIPRFIVATHHLSAGAERWRSGVILRKGKNAALVRGDAAGTPPRVRILVTGPVATRRGLLEVVRNEFDQIHASTPGLGVEERVPVPGLDVDPLGYDALLAYEAAGKKAVTVVVAGRLVELPLAGLLDGVDPKPKRAARAKTNQFLAEFQDATAPKPKRAARAKRNPAALTFHVYAGEHARVSFTTDSHDATVGGDNYGQVAQALTNCTNAVTAMPAGERQDRAAELVARVEALLRALPADRQGEASEVAEHLEAAVRQAASTKPNRKYYSVSAEGLLEAATWVKDFSGNVAGAVSDLGRSMWPDFAVVPVRPTKETRRRLVLAPQTEGYTSEVSAHGHVHEFNRQARTLEIVRPDGSFLAKIPVTQQQHDALVEASVGAGTKTRVRVAGVGRFDRAGRLLAFADVESVTLLDPRDVRARLDELRALEPGWLDGEGVPLDDRGLDWLAEAFDQHYPPKMALPYIYPTPEGRVLVEWASGAASPSLEIDLHTKTGEWHVLQKDGVEKEETFDLADGGGWTSVVSQLTAYKLDEK